MASSRLFSSFEIRGLNIRNRLFMSPMCQYSAPGGVAQPWHLVHLGSRATGGVGLVMTEAAAVSATGRISPDDLGLWSSEQMRALRPINEFIHSQGAVSAVQLAHAGRKASTVAPWKAGRVLTPDQGGWMTIGPSAKAYSETYPVPHEMTDGDIAVVTQEFLYSADLAKQAGFQVVELHMAHGYLFHQFLSPLSNFRTDQYGGSLENRMRFPLQVAEAVRRQWPAELPLFVRISATDWVENGWGLPESVIFCKRLKQIGVDLIDCSSGGLSPLQKIPVTPGYQVPFAEEIRKEVGISTGAVGLITEAAQAEEILQKNQADAIFLGRELLRNPYWTLSAAKSLGAEISWPPQYDRAKI